jgi:hypothetical protein
MSNTILPPFRPDSMTPAQLAAVSYLARYVDGIGPTIRNHHWCGKGA